MNFAVYFAVLSWMLANQGLAQLLDENCAEVSRLSTDLRFSRPWMALVLMPNKTCSGALIHKYFVITSASCVFNQERTIVRLGQWSIKQKHSIRYRIDEYQVQSSYIHRFYDKSNFGHDVALLELQNEVLYKAHIRPICLWLDKFDIDTQKIERFQTFRWGIEEKFILPAAKTRKMEHIRKVNCENAFKFYPQSSHICASFENKRNCVETGSPLFNKIRYHKNTRYNLFGIQSYGESGTCLYTDVTKYMDWIMGIILNVDVIVSNGKNTYA
ncbi:serine protease grass [Drosophila simulans]|uniref:serine protease grass n=1 Tax=Drosophila simulans TaxID=7240 RepID=UPI00078AF0BF|nr:serine protease grass [Drosophila simulans]KMZ06413.1 uncharacterized protein Dsimw501_GD21367 [Drosophila simulans]